MFVEQLFSIDGKTAVVVGASRGIGEEIAVSFKKAGANLICLSRSSAPDNNELKGDYQQCDISNPPVFDRICKQAIEKYGSIDIFVNAAGITIPVDKNNNSTNFDEIVNINLVSHYKCLKIVSKYMFNGGSIINITSIGSVLGFPENPGYIASKGGVMALTKSLAMDLSPKNIRVNNIVPGYIETDMTKKSFKDTELYNERLSRMIIKRWGNVEDIAGAAIFLASNSSSYMTGTDIVIDGGWTAKGI